MGFNVPQARSSRRCSKSSYSQFLRLSTPSSNAYPRLLAHELLHVVGAACAPAGGSAGLPSAERIDAGPRAGRGTGAPVHIGDASLDAIEEPRDLALV